MKSQASYTSGGYLRKSVELENQHSSQNDFPIFHDDANTDSDKDSGFSNDDEIKQNKDTVITDVYDVSVKELKILLNHDEPNETEIILAVKSISKKLEEIPEVQRQTWMYNEIKEIFSDNLPNNLLEIVSARFFEGDTGISVDTKPEWLDMDKFRRGQVFAVNNLSSIAYANLISLFALYSFLHELKPIIATGNSSTPYTSFKRYLSTNVRVHNWYKSDPWTPGTPAYRDIKAVRNLHALVRKRMSAMSAEEYAEKSSIKEPWCPVLNIIRQDFQTNCPVAKPGQCPFAFLNKYNTINGIFLSQGEMIATQFGFIGLVILRPEFFGIHHATDDNLEDFLHVWRGIGYLLGIHDNYNFCRGTLKDVRIRCSEFLEYWIKPNLRQISPEWEHMMRCVMQGIRYYYPGSSYEGGLLDLAEIMNLKMPRLYKTLTYSQWISRFLIKLYLRFFLRFYRCRLRFNYFLEKRIESALKYEDEKHEELEKKSAETLLSYAMNLRESKSLDDKPHSEQ